VRLWPLKFITSLLSASKFKAWSAIPQPESQPSIMHDVISTAGVPRGLFKDCTGVPRGLALKSLSNSPIAASFHVAKSAGTNPNESLVDPQLRALNDYVLRPSTSISGEDG